MDDFKTETVPLTMYESHVARFTRAIRYMAIGWAMSVIAMGLVLVISLSYTEEVVTETVTQESTEYGSNHYIGGDLNGEANYYPDDAND